MALLLIIRYVLSSENKRRDQEQLDNSYDDVYIERMGKDGQVERVKVDKVIILVVYVRECDIIYELITDLFCECFIILGIPGSYRYPESRF